MVLLVVLLFFLEVCFLLLEVAFLRFDVCGSASFVDACWSPSGSPSEGMPALIR